MSAERRAIRDAKKPSKLTINRVDVAKSKEHAGDDTACALAQAADRRGWTASVGATVVYIARPGSKFIERYRLSKNDQAIIRAFDDSTIFPTITVTLLPPTKPFGSRKGEQHGTNKRSGQANTVRQHVERPPSRRASVERARRDES